MPLDLVRALGDAARTGVYEDVEHRLASQARWHTAGEVGEPSLQSPWLRGTAGPTLGEPTNTPAYYPQFCRDHDGIVRMRGLAHSPTGCSDPSLLLTFPPGFRPFGTLEFIPFSFGTGSSASNRLLVDVNGGLYLTVTATVISQLFFGQVSFRAA